ncbi:MAG: ABC transporter ATP-binding protein [Spirochaetales bacterium]
MKGSEVRVENADKKFGDFHALKNVSLTIGKGEFFSLLGPSGCGKTTLLRIIAGFEGLSSGAVYLDGKDVLPLPPNERHVNTVFQNYALFPHLSVFENIAFPLRLKKMDKAAIQEKVTQYLQLVHLVGQENKKPNQLSGGQKQRVAIARALINEPSVLLLDEPLSALDAKLRHQLLLDLDLIHDQIGITFIYVTHDQSEALSVSDRIAVMSEGRVLQIGTPFEIYEAPADSFVAKFIGETNILDGRITAHEGNLYTIDTDGVGPIQVTSDREFAVGARVRHAIRPEKIDITKEKPAGLPDDFTILHGKVAESIYSGFQSQFYVETVGSLQFKVYQQHESYIERGPAIRWTDEVYINWDADDGYIVELI